MRRIALALTILFAAGARANTNDFQLWRLGHPDSITVCTLCNGTDNTTQPGDPNAQYKFARLAGTVALGFAPAFEDQAQTTGVSGFELGATGQVVFPQLQPAEWPTEGTSGFAPVPQALVIPTITLRKGLGGSLEIGGAASMLFGSEMIAVSGQVRWAIVEGLPAPDIALRAWGTRLLNAREMDLWFGGADILVSKSFGIFGTTRLQPYAQYGMVLAEANTASIDFNPGAAPSGNPSDNHDTFHRVAFYENRYHRFTAGIRLIRGSLLLGVEGGLAFGTNPVQHDPVTAGPTEQETRLWTAAARLGLAF
ncbi:MAG TPA: hypothetical protein VG496_02080 [Myxococcales bacterium]|nr:hypothetical protein [Myxococcales bacterium]